MVTPASDYEWPAHWTPHYSIINRRSSFLQLYSTSYFITRTRHFEPVGPPQFAKTSMSPSFCEHFFLVSYTPYYLRIMLRQNHYHTCQCPHALSYLSAIFLLVGDNTDPSTNSLNTADLCFYFRAYTSTARERSGIRRSIKLVLICFKCFTFADTEVWPCYYSSLNPYPTIS